MAQDILYRRQPVDIKGGVPTVQGTTVCHSICALERVTYTYLPVSFLPLSVLQRQRSSTSTLSHIPNIITPRNATMSISRHPVLFYLSCLCSAICLGFGITYIFYPRTGYSLYGFSSAPSSESEWARMERLMVLFGAKDMFLATSILASTWVGTRKSAGIILMAVGGCAGIDGWVVRQEGGTNGWNHWGYGCVMGALGAVTMGLLG
jgi:hypothetical protein